MSVRAVEEDQGYVCNDEFPQEMSEMRALVGRACQNLVVLGELLYAAFLHQAAAGCNNTEWRFASVGVW